MDGARVVFNLIVELVEDQHQAGKQKAECTL